MAPGDRKRILQKSAVLALAALRFVAAVLAVRLAVALVPGIDAQTVAALELSVEALLCDLGGPTRRHTYG